jgi:hypothetical protein
MRTNAGSEEQGKSICRQTAISTSGRDVEEGEEGKEEGEGEAEVD